MKILLIIFNLAVGFQLFSQELFAKVIVNTDQIKDRLDKSFSVDMQNNISNFINAYKWTEHTYQANEKINCTFQINITNFSGSRYSANVQVAASRPVYNTTYETQTFSFADMDWEFDYSQSSTIAYNENAYVNALSSLISFYVYMVLAHDYDSFSKFGGQPYFDKAQQIMNSAASTSDKGWKMTDGSNARYWIIENLTNPQQQALREANYNYHRMALDKFADTPEKSREVIVKVLEEIKKMNAIRPNTLTMKWFFTMKSSEMVKIFSKAPKEMKQKVYDLLRELDPTHTTLYEDILKNN